MNEDYRALCAELLKVVEISDDFIMNEKSTVELADRARAALAEPLPPADEDVGYLVRYLRDWGDDYSNATEFHRAADLLERLAVPDGYIDAEHAGCDREMLETFYSVCQSEGGTADEITLRGLRAVLARWGRPTPQPTTKRLPDDAQVIEPEGRTLLAPAPQPIPVTERLPEAGDCDAEGRCWWEFGGSDEFGPSWTLMRMHGIPSDMTRWLPIHVSALPLPSGRGE